MATSTVEDYLKCIYLRQESGSLRRVSTGEIASALEVAPGTVTAMMKTLTESGLVAYEPYAGVRLSARGERLAARVLRRHRLVELFLVRVMEMDWSEVHEEAEILEHAVSDRLIDRMDRMLDYPSVDPHGDPIPSAGGSVKRFEYPNLRTCAPATRVRIVRVTDQRPDFLQLLERHGLMPDRIATLEACDTLTETVRVVVELGSPLQLGFHAAERILVEPV